MSCQNLMERAVILTKLPPLSAHVVTEQELVTLREPERSHILKALRESNWIVSGAFGAAERLGLKRTTLIDKMRRHGISRETAVGPFAV